MATKKYNFIYKTTNVLTERYYYGMHSTDDLDDGYVGSGRRLKYSINKYGKENHKREIIEFVENRKQLKQREREIVNLNEIAKEKCMNLMVGGKGGFHKKSFGGNKGRYRGRVNSNKVINERLKTDVEFRNYWISQTSKGVKKYIEQNGHNWIGRKHTEETKEKQRISGKGKHIGEKNSQYGTCWINNSIIVKKIKKENLDKYLSQGWVKGRTI